MSQENVEVVGRLLGALQEAWGRRGNVDDAFDSAAAFDSVDDDVEWIPAPEVPGPASYRGRDGFVEFMRAWTEDFEHWSIHLERLIDAGDNRVVALQHQSAIGKGSGVPVDLHFGAIFELKDLCVTRVRLYRDIAEALEAAGLSE